MIVSTRDAELVSSCVSALGRYGASAQQFLTGSLSGDAMTAPGDILFRPLEGPMSEFVHVVEVKFVSAPSLLPDPVVMRALSLLQQVRATQPQMMMRLALATNGQLFPAARAIATSWRIDVLQNVTTAAQLTNQILAWAQVPRIPHVRLPIETVQNLIGMVADWPQSALASEAPRVLNGWLHEPGLAMDDATRQLIASTLSKWGTQ